MSELICVDKHTYVQNLNLPTTGTYVCGYCGNFASASHGFTCKIIDDLYKDFNKCQHRNANRLARIKWGTKKPAQPDEQEQEGLGQVAVVHVGEPDDPL